MSARLSRTALRSSGATVIDPPVRIVHLGLGAFHRAHQAWYTRRASDASDWGIAAFTGRRPDAADLLAPQEGLFTLVERGPEGDRFEVIDSIVRVGSGEQFVAALSDPAVAILTLTITEAGYGAAAAELPESALGRVIRGLDARRRAGAPRLAIVPCDNLPANGALVSRALHDRAAHVDPELADWLDRGVSVVSTSVDRITPRTTAADREEVLRATGWDDASPVVTEPFADWTLSGDFPSGRPHWESAGARFVDDIAPWEARKLWLLNGAHTLLASAGPARGHSTVAEAIADPQLRQAVDTLWADAARHLPDVETQQYRALLLERFANPRIEHRLAQIAEDSLLKLRLRIVPVARLERAAGRPALGAAIAIAAWIGRTGGQVADIDPELGRDRQFIEEVERAIP